MYVIVIVHSKFYVSVNIFSLVNFIMKKKTKLKKSPEFFCFIHLIFSSIADKYWCLDLLNHSIYCILACIFDFMPFPERFPHF